MHITDQPVQDWLKSLEDPRIGDLKALDTIIADAFAGDSRVLWVGKFWGGTDQTIIGYGDLVQKRPKGDPVRWFVVGLALQKAHISVYVNAVKEGQYIGKAYGKQLGKVKIGSASIGFKSLADLDRDVFTAMLIEARDLAV